ncbi:hypothetical protein DDV96_12840 [Marixanthomonas spongiae]|uniref:Uncharacterized protein n=2 Tax=Marixanthomonas spongiae TaxID=2174845 RepID=A0A2U0HXI6_9FLAO|nr:hypothetical protein DDV96_12840 [Marixanthomonas spongiae]
MYKRNVVTTVLLTVLFAVNLYSQKVETIRMEVEKEIPGETFSDNKFEVDFWVQTEGFSAIDPQNTELLELKDDTGKDLLKAHEKEVQAYEEETERLAKEGHYRFSTRTEGFIRPDQWKKMYDTLGFKATLKSQMVVPSPKATKVHVKMKIGYTQKVVGDEKSTKVTFNALASDPTARLLGASVPIQNNSSMTHDGSKYIFYTFPETETPVAITRIEPETQALKTANEKTQVNNRPNEFLVKQGDDTKPVSIKVYYQEVEKKSLLIDKWVSVGL